jgi:hypothetical protein
MVAAGLLLLKESSVGKRRGRCIGGSGNNAEKLKEVWILGDLHHAACITQHATLQHGNIATGNIATLQQATLQHCNIATGNIATLQQATLQQATLQHCNIATLQHCSRQHSTAAIRVVC